ncbi:MAG: hypothetical protein JHC26_07465 [Thermofilum sp.]|uniref:hypothetical protein n=1 Tax=Thermofilum sp. TaxID=1961369 RepID=UPI00258826C7|nr:hypothetical protein [Thermofilum sp.]MCI4408915.1 hypothetical protein [Thermofilum sp.]
MMTRGDKKYQKTIEDDDCRRCGDDLASAERLIEQETSSTIVQKRGKLKSII